MHATRFAYCRRLDCEFVYTLQRQGIDMDALAAQLQKEGAESFVKSWDEMMDVVAKKAQAFK